MILARFFYFPVQKLLVSCLSRRLSFIDYGHLFGEFQEILISFLFKAKNADFLPLFLKRRGGVIQFICYFFTLVSPSATAR